MLRRTSHEDQPGKVQLHLLPLVHENTRKNGNNALKTNKKDVIMDAGRRTPDAGRRTPDAGRRKIPR